MRLLLGFWIGWCLHAWLSSRPWWHKTLAQIRRERRESRAN